MSIHAKRTQRPEGGFPGWRDLSRVAPYVWEYRGRALAAILSLVVAKLATVAVPLTLKGIVDALDTGSGRALTLPLVLLLAYGALRVASSLFSELRDAVFARVRYNAMRRLSVEVLERLHALSLRYHLDRRTGNIARDLERGTQSVSSILNYLVFNILPTLAEFGLVAVVLFRQYPARFAGVTFATVLIYILFTVSLTNWRMHFRHTMNALDSQASGHAIDSLLNYETVKYFNNEAFEVQRYGRTLAQWTDAAARSTVTMAILNFGQGLIIALGVTLIMIFAAHGVVIGTLSLGDLVLVNVLMLQLFLPLNFLGVIYRALNYAFADMDRILKLLKECPEVVDSPNARPLELRRVRIRFEEVHFAYTPERPILRGIDFEIPSSSKVAVVGPSGAGKSTLARLLFRFYDVTGGRITIDDQDIRECTLESVHRAIGVVPQDTVLFNETLFYNIRYGRPDASRDEVMGAARMAALHDFIERLPKGYETVVGERGLKLSGGEKQRVAIARVILKRPRILVFDEATSSLDSRSEQAILTALKEISAHTTTLAIAHRLSTIVDADQILVLDAGRVVERGGHRELLQTGGLYAHLWSLQQEERLVEREAELRAPE